MGAAGRKAFNFYCQLPDGVRCHTDKAIRVCAKATKGLRDEKAIKRRGEASMRGLRKKLRV
jgi:hypothetical protein